MELTLLFPGARYESTKNSDVDKIWGNMLGADGYLSKPIDREELVVILKRLIH